MTKSMSWVVENELVEDFKRRRASIKNLRNVEQVTNFKSGIERLEELKKYQEERAKLNIDDMVFEQRLGKPVSYPKVYKLSTQSLGYHRRHDFRNPKNFRQMLQGKSLASRKRYTDALLKFEHI